MWISQHGVIRTMCYTAMTLWHYELQPLHLPRGYDLKIHLHSEPSIHEDTIVIKTFVNASLKP